MKDHRVALTVLWYKNGVVIEDNRHFSIGQAYVRRQGVFVQDKYGQYYELPEDWEIA